RSGGRADPGSSRLWSHRYSHGGERAAHGASMLLVHWYQRKTQDVFHLSHHRQRGLHRQRIGLEECRSHPRQQTKVSLTRADEVAVAHALTQLAHQPRRRVRDDGDDAVAAGGHHRERHLIVTRQHTEMWRTVAKNVGDLAEVARRFLYRDDSGPRGERER